MTLPCIGPLVISTFVLGVGHIGSLAEGVIDLVAAGLGVGWPLVFLPIVAAPVRCQTTRWVAALHTGVERWSGALLIAVAAYGCWVDVLPSLR